MDFDVCYIFIVMISKKIEFLIFCLLLPEITHLLLDLSIKIIQITDISVLPSPYRKSGMPGISPKVSFPPTPRALTHPSRDMAVDKEHLKNQIDKNFKGVNQ